MVVTPLFLTDRHGPLDGQRDDEEGQGNREDNEPQSTRFKCPGNTAKEQHRCKQDGEQHIGVGSVIGLHGSFKVL